MHYVRALFKSSRNVVSEPPAIDPIAQSYAGRNTPAPAPPKFNRRAPHTGRSHTNTTTPFTPASAGPIFGKYPPAANRNHYIPRAQIPSVPGTILIRSENRRSTRSTSSRRELSVSLWPHLPLSPAVQKSHERSQSSTVKAVVRNTSKAKVKAQNDVTRAPTQPATMRIKNAKVVEMSRAK